MIEPTNKRRIQHILRDGIPAQALAEWLGLTRRQVLRMAKSGKLPRYRQAEVSAKLKKTWVHYEPASGDGPDLELAR